MKLHVLDMPEEAPRLAGWLEEHLLGLDLAEVAAELYAVRCDDSAPRSLDDVLGPDLPRVLAGGLSVLSAEKIRELLRNPELLLQLQVRIFLDGGDYWNRPASASPGLSAHVERGRERVQMFLVSQRAAAPVGPDDERRAGRPRRVHPLLVSLATAAAVLLGVFLVKPGFGPPTPVASGWGWSRPGAIDGSLSSSAYLTKLADGANDWFNQTPATSEALAKRIGEFRQGCSTLILAEHRPLTPEDKAWLVERCQAWAKKLDTHLADVEAGKDVLQVRAEADETIHKLIKALRTRAEAA